jgi:transposase-like protein
MNRNQHSDEFREQALSKVRHRGTRSVRDIAEELSMSAGTLRKWWASSNRATVKATPPAELPSALPAESWVAAQRLLALHQTHGLSGDALHAWCREKGLFEHQLIAWRDAFCAIAAPESRDTKLALRELQTRHDGLQRELRRKEKALAEAAALLVLQKKFQALWEDGDT